MFDVLRSRAVHKLPDRVRFQGRVLFLTEDPALVQRQLEGWDLEWTPAAKRLRATGVSPNSEVYRTMSAAARRLIFASGLMRASPDWFLTNMPLVT